MRIPAAPNRYLLRTRLNLLVLQAVEHVLNKKLVPGLADGEKSARELVEEQLRERAKLKYSAPVLAADTARATTAVVKKLRVGVWAAGAAGGAVRTGMALRGLLTRVAQRHQSRVPCEDDDLF